MSKNTVYTKQSASPGLPGRITKNARKARNVKVAPQDLICPDGCAWLEQLTSVFDGHNTTMVDMPLAEDSWGCPSVLAFNYASFEVTPTGAQASIWGLPGGHRDGTNVHAGEISEQTFVGAQRANVGSVLSCASSDGCMAAYEDGNHPALVGNTSTMFPIMFPALTSPFITGRAASGSLTGLQGRTVAFGIRVSYIGRLSETEGYIDFVSPAEYPINDGAGTDTMEAQRADASFRRHFFGTNRTHTFYWTPNCDEVKYMDNFGETKHATASVNCRFMLQLNGLTGGNDKFLIEVAAIQGFTGNKSVTTQIPRPVSPDAQHIINALQVHRGAHHPVSDNAKRKIVSGGKKLTLVASGMKARSSPALRYLTDTAQFVTNNWSNIEKLGAIGARAVGKLAGMLM